MLLTIDLHQEFQDNLTNNHNVGFILDSLLGTAYQFDDIKEVEFLIDGAPIGYLDMYDFSVPFERPNPEVKEKNKKQKVSPMRNEPDADPVIVIDPGHGGKDPGSIGSDGTEEADLNLEIAKKLRDYLEDRLNATVYMTRTTDKYIDLDKRYALANEKKADIFISVHINSSSNSSVKGTTVIYPNNHHIKLSREAADFVHNRVIDVLRDYKSPYEDNRNLAVLRGTKMPAILTETGFISNSSDLKYLKSNSGQDEIANKIYRGVKDWWFD
ncbi:N-acetylmuramoyl-L-alanine amidase [Brevibacillus laterosporus]|uniref:N-acetylmuramoyl-L-alanine amidase n=1 Tax=Brevibacillus laterosporus TaxID=1465 RepID=UPI003D1FFB79